MALPGAEIAGWVLEELLAHEFFVSCWRARHAATSALAHVEIFSAGELHTPELHAQMQATLAVALAANHPHVPRPIAGGLHNARELYLITEWIEGVELGQLRASGRWNTPEGARRAALLMGQVAHTLADAAAWPDAETGEPAQLLHNDLREERIIVSPGDHVWVRGFGTLLPPPPPPMHFSGPIPLPMIIAPEGIRGELSEATPGQAVYAVGVHLHQLIAGTPPFGGQSAFGVVLGIINGSPPVTPGSAPWCSSALIGVMERALAADPAVRYATPRHLGWALDAALALDEVAFLPRAHALGWLRERLYEERWGEGAALLGLRADVAHDDATRDYFKAHAPPLWREAAAWMRAELAPIRGPDAPTLPPRDTAPPAVEAQEAPAPDAPAPSGGLLTRLWRMIRGTRR